MYAIYRVEFSYVTPGNERMARSKYVIIPESPTAMQDAIAMATRNHDVISVNSAQRTNTLNQEVIVIKKG